MDERPSSREAAQRSWYWSPPTILPLEPKLLAAAATFARDTASQRAAALRHGQLAWRLFGFGLFLRAVRSLFGFGDGRFEREAHPLRFGIDIQHFALDLFPLLHHVFDFIDLVMRQFRNVNQSFDARRELDEGAELRDARDGPFDGAADREPLLDIHPRMLFGVLQRKANLAGRFVDPLDSHADLLAFLDDFARMLHSFPGKLADVNQPIDASHID